MSQPVTILHLEDSDLDAEFVKDRLAHGGLAVTIDRVRDRKDFISRLEAVQFDVILSGYQVPPFEGLDALKLAREHQPGTPFIFVSGMMGEEHAVDALKQGATDYVMKQRLARLPAAVERALAERRERVERKQAEERSAAILENMGEGFVVLDPEWRHSYVNAAAERLLGRGRQEILGKDHWELYPATVGTELESIYRRVMTQRVTIDFENYFSPWDRWYAIKAVPAPVDGGIYVQFRDVTDAKRAEQALRDSEERFRSLFTSMDQGYSVVEVLFDPDGVPQDYRFLQVNPAFEKHTGLTAAAGRTALELVPGLSRFWVETYGRVAATGEPARFVDHEPAMGGRWFDVNAFRLGGPDSRKVAILHTDVTAKKRGEEALKASEAWFRTLADASPAILWVTDPTGRCTFLSRGWYEFTGQTEEEGLGLGWLDATHPEDKERSGASFMVANAKHEPFAIDYRIRRADGEYRRAIDAGRPRFSPSGEYLGYVGLVLDVTDWRRAEEALQVSEDRLAFVRKSSGVGFWYCDLPFDVLEWDEQVKTHFHLPRAAHVTIGTFYDRLHPDDREPTRQAIERSIAKKVPYDVDYRTVDPATGAQKWVRAIGRTFYAENGTVLAQRERDRWVG